MAARDSYALDREFPAMHVTGTPNKDKAFYKNAEVCTSPPGFVRDHGHRLLAHPHPGDQSLHKNQLLPRPCASASENHRSLLLSRSRGGVIESGDNQTHSLHFRPQLRGTGLSRWGSSPLLPRYPGRDCSSAPVAPPTCSPSSCTLLHSWHSSARKQGTKCTSKSPAQRASRGKNCAALAITDHELPTRADKLHALGRLQGKHPSTHPDPRPPFLNPPPQIRDFPRRLGCRARILSSRRGLWPLQIQHDLTLPWFQGAFGLRAQLASPQIAKPKVDPSSFPLSPLSPLFLFPTLIHPLIPPSYLIHVMPLPIPLLFFLFSSFLLFLLPSSSSSPITSPCFKTQKLKLQTTNPKP